jgi:hypothetical protein
VRFPPGRARLGDKARCNWVGSDRKDDRNDGRGLFGGARSNVAGACDDHVDLAVHTVLPSAQITSTALSKGGIMREAMDRAARTGSAIDLCRVALKCGKLVRQGRHWRYGRRFSNATVKQLIDEGIAVRDGDLVWASERRLST